jgi:hypothetical protein
MHIEILEDNIDITTILKEANNIKISLNKGWSNINQVGLQGTKPDQDPAIHCFDSVGKFDKTKYPETYFKYPLFNAPTINRIIEKYNLKRTRIMQSSPKSCYTIHSDLSMRIHIPIITNPDCLMLIENKAYHLEAGKIYLTNTTFTHTAINASLLNRVHIIGCFYQ